MIRPKKARLLQRRAMSGYLFALPLIVGLVLVFIPNLVQTFRFAVNDIRLGTDGYTLSSVGFRYFREAFDTDPNFVPYLIASLRSFVTDIPIILVFSLFIASVLNTEFRGRVAARIIFFIPVILATGVIAAVENASDILGIVEDGRQLDLGLGSGQKTEIATLLTQIDLPKALIDLIGGAIAKLYDIVKSSGMQIYILLIGMQEISPSIYEAAQVEGCGRWEFFWKITFPMIGAEIKVCVVYTIIDILANGQGTLVDYIDGLAFRNDMYAQGTAMYVVYLCCIALIVAAVLLLLKRLIRYQGEEAR